MKLAHMTDTTEASGATLKPSTADSSQSLINTFASSGQLHAVCGWYVDAISSVS